MLWILAAVYNLALHNVELYVAKSSAKYEAKNSKEREKTRVMNAGFPDIVRKVLWTWKSWKCLLEFQIFETHPRQTLLEKRVWNSTSDF